MRTRSFLPKQWPMLGLLVGLIINPIVLATAAVPGGISFVEGPWETVLANAKKEHKFIFVAIQQKLCDPCRKLEKNAFSDAAVGRKYAASFSSYTLNATEGNGPALVKQYAVATYPTLLFLSENGVLLHRSTGYSGAKGLLLDADITLETARNPRTIAVWDREFKAGKRDGLFLRAYLEKRAYLGLPNEAALEAYLQRIPETDWALRKNALLIADNSETARLPSFNWLLDVAEKATKDPLQSTLVFHALGAVNRVVQREWETAKTPADLEGTITIWHRLDNLSGTVRTADEQAQRDMGMRMSFYGRTKNQAKYRELALPVGAQAMTATNGLRRAVEADFQQPIDYNDQSEAGKATAARLVAERTNRMRDSQTFAWRLNSLAHAYLDLMTDPADLQQALTWSARAVELVALPQNLDTYAQVLYRLGRKAEAIETEKEAIAQASSAGYDTQVYEKVLMKMMRK